MNNLIKDIKLIVYNRKLMICLICFIITICALVGAYRYNNKSGENNGIRVGVVNNDDSPYSSLLVNFFKSNESFLELANIVEDNENTIKTEFDEGNIDAYIIIPKGFSDSLMYLENIRIQIRINQEKEVEAIVMKAVLTSYETYVTSVQNNAVGLYSSLKKSGLNRKDNMKINVVSSWDMVNMALAKEGYFDYKIIEQKKTSLVEHYIYTIIFALIIYYSIYVGVQIKKEQEMGVDKMYTLAKGNKVSYILSKVCVNGAVIYVFLAIVIYIINKVLKFNFGENIYSILLLYVSIIITLISLLSYVIKDKNVYVICTNGVALLLIVIGGGIIPPMYMPQNLSEIIKYMPIDILERMIQG